MNVEGKTKVFLNNNNGKEYYSISDGSKDVDGNWTNKNWSVRFKKGQEPQHDRRISFKGFMTYYAKQYDDKKVIYTTIQVMEWEYDDDQQNDHYEYNFDFSKDAVSVDDDDLAF